MSQQNQNNKRISQRQMSPDTPKNVSIKQPRLLESPYGYVSFRQLTVMKIIDRTSLYITGLAPEFANLAVVTSYSWFGAFGRIGQVRIIQSKQNEVYIRYVHEESAINAMMWVNQDLQPSIGASAKHGYQKYCTKFLQRKKCNRAQCQMLHEWKDFKEVLNQEKVQKLNPLNRKSGLRPIFPQQMQLPTNANNSPDPKETKDPSSSPSYLGNMLLVQRQINEMQRTFDESKEVLTKMLEDVALLEHENARLRSENADHAKRLGFAMPPQQLVEFDHDVDSIVEELLNEMDLNSSNGSANMIEFNASANTISSNSANGSPYVSDYYSLSDSMTASTWQRKYTPTSSSMTI